MIFPYAVVIERLPVYSLESSAAVNEFTPLSYNAAQVCTLASFIRYGSASPNAAYNNKSGQLAKKTLEEFVELKYAGAA